MTSFRRRALLCFLSAALAGTLTSCQGEQATAEFCSVVLDRIVEVELTELGFRDLALAEMKRRDMRRLFAGDIQRCVGRRVAPGALACVRAAASTEEIAHQCLR